MPDAYVEDDDLEEEEAVDEEPEEYAASVEEPGGQVASWQQSPDTREELDYETFNPSDEYSQAFSVLQKDLVLANLDKYDRKYILLAARNDSDLKRLEEKEDLDLSDTRMFFLRDVMTKIESSRAIDAQTLRLLKTKIQRYTGRQTVTQKQGGDEGFWDKVKRKAPSRGEERRR